jgi:hypothetical protein
MTWYGVDSDVVEAFIRFFFSINRTLLKYPKRVHKVSPSENTLYRDVFNEIRLHNFIREMTVAWCRFS